MLNDILFFPRSSIAEDELGQIIKTDEVFDRQVFCLKQSIPRIEYYQKEMLQAGQSSVKKSCVLIVYTIDYNEEDKLMYKNTIYHVYRTFDRNDEHTELYCEVKIGD